MPEYITRFGRATQMIPQGHAAGHARERTDQIIERRAIKSAG